MGRSPVLLYAAQSLYLFAPLLVASGFSALVMHFNWFASYFTPIDAGRTVRGRPLFGDHKTWRGVVVAILGSTLGVLLQKEMPSAWTAELSLVDYSRANPFAMGAAMGCGATLGELPNSFVKRQLGVAPGSTASGLRRALFFVWDQVDTLTGAWPLLLPWIHPSPAVLLSSFAVALLLHPCASGIGYLLGVRNTPR